MKVPHRGADGARSRARCRAVALAVEEKIAPRKRDGCEFARGACECAAEVIIRAGVMSRKSRTAAAQNRCDLWRGRATLEQFLGDPLIGDAPVGLWEAFQDVQPVHPMGIDFGRGSARCGGSRCRRQVWKRRQARRAAQPMLGRFQQSRALGRQAGMGIQYLHPRSVAPPVAALWFLIGDAGQAAQMAPIGAGYVAAVGVRQLFADLAGDSGVEECGADSDPSLEVAGAALKYHTGIVTSGSHGFHGSEAAVIQIDEDITWIAFGGVGLDVNVATLAVAHAQKSHRSRMYQLGGGPQPLSGKGPLGWMVDQADQVKIVRHRRELAAYGLRGEIESEVEHGLNFGIERTAVQ